MESNLKAVRVKAAQASKGTSTEPVYKTILERINELDISGYALDFGAGAGYLAKAMCKTGRFSLVDAVDLVDYASVHDSRIQWVFTDLNEPMPIAAATYDLIVAAEVIEHLENPRFLAREWFRLLRPGGALIVSTPNNESWRSILSLIVRGHFAQFTGASYPAHITALLRKDFTRIFAETGFKQVGFTFTNNGVIPKLTSHTWGKVSFGVLKGLRYSDNLVCVARKPAYSGCSKVEPVRTSVL